MKLLATLLLTTFTYAYGQNGTNCLDAISVTPSSVCVYQSYTTSTSSIWFKFTAISENVNISLITAKFGLNQAHIHNISLFEGNCGSLTLKTEDELPFEDEAEKLAIDLNASGLIVGNTYYLKADREAHAGECDKLTCRNNQSTTPAIFDLCIENIDILIPLDFGLESPSSEHGYEQNRGQLSDFNGNMNTTIKMFTKDAWPQVCIAENFTSFVWSKVDTNTTTIDTVHRIDLTLVNSSPSRVFKTEELNGQCNYYLPHIPKGILKNKSYSRVVQKDVYPGIDMQFYSNEKGVKFYFIVNPGSQANLIKLKFTGATTTSLTQTGSLLVNSVLGELKFKRAIVYRINPAGNIVPMPVSGDFIQTGPDEYSVVVQNYPDNMPVIIQIEKDIEIVPKSAGDPTWSTYYGGNQDDAAFEIDSDDQGNIYVGGATSSNNFFPITAGAQFSNLNGNYDGWLGKFDVNYVREWTTYIGGVNYDAVSGVDHDDNNNIIYIGMGAQNSSTGNAIAAQQLNNDPSSFASSINSGTYIARFTESGFREWGTWLPGHYFPESYHNIKVKVDSEGNVIAVGTVSDVSTYQGNTPSGGYPIYATSPNAYKQMNWAGGDPDLGDSFGDGFIAKFDAQTHLVWSTLFGGNRDEIIFNLAIDPNNGDINIVGSTRSDLTNPTSCPTTVNYPFFDGRFPLCEIPGGYFQNTISNATDEDGFIARFSKFGELKWSTFFGGNGADFITGIDIYSGGSIIITGATKSTFYGNTNCTAPTNQGFPFCDNGGYTQNSLSSPNAFIAEFRDNALLKWSTFLGGNLYDGMTGPTDNEICSWPKVHVADNLKIYVFGNTQSGSIYTTGLYPTVENPSYYNQDSHSDYNTLSNVKTDNFVTMFQGGEMQWSTYFGGSSSTYNKELAGGITTYNDRIYICGTTDSPSNFPLNCPPTVTTVPYCDVNILSSTDAYIAQLVQEGVTNVGISEITTDEETGLHIYPNPTDGSFIISWSGHPDDENTIEIYNQIGQVIFKINNNCKDGNCQEEINLSQFANGIYIVTVLNNKSYTSTKLIKY